MSDALQLLLDDGIIDAVLGRLKTGKEAEVWLVEHAGQVVAAKIYKERHARNFRNNAGYREGREVRNSRTRRAIEKGSRFGQQAAEDAWKSTEADALYTLHAAGVRVPTPVMFYEGVLLMELVPDAAGQPAPRLVEAPPRSPEEALAWYADLRGHVVRMLACDIIHGDLSAYNILSAWNGPTIIDFPQVVAAAKNNRAEQYFRRDLDNVRTFLAGYAPQLEAAAGETSEIWNAYVRRELTADYVPPGKLREAPRRTAGPGGPRGAGQGQRPPRAREEQRRAAPVADTFRAPAPPPPAEPGLSAEEAELRALEALVLRQGGGERGRPVAPAASKGGRPGRGPKGRPGAGAPRGPRPPGGTAPRGPNHPAQGRPAANTVRPPSGGAPQQPAAARAGPPAGAPGGTPGGRPPPGAPRHERGPRPERGGPRVERAARPAGPGPQGEARGPRNPGAPAHVERRGPPPARQGRDARPADTREGGRPPRAPAPNGRGRGGPVVAYVSRPAPAARGPETAAPGPAASGPASAAPERPLAASKRSRG